MQVGKDGMLKAIGSLGNECFAEVGRREDYLWIKQNINYIYDERIEFKWILGK